VLGVQKGPKPLFSYYRAEDKPAVLALHKLGLQSTGAWIDSGRWDEDLNNIEQAYTQNGVFLVGEINGNVVAMGALRRKTDNVGEIKRLRISPEFQRMGFGQLIMTTLEQKARELGYTKIVLDTTIKQIGAQTLFLKNGYRETKREHVKTPNIDTELIYYEKDV
jgi:N-acetylglutamate synthase-like GNAT family acetyltransferase